MPASLLSQLGANSDTFISSISDRKAAPVLNESGSAIDHDGNAARVAFSTDAGAWWLVYDFVQGEAKSA